MWIKVCKLTGNKNRPKVNYFILKNEMKAMKEYFFFINGNISYYHGNEGNTPIQYPYVS